MNKIFNRLLFHIIAFVLLLFLFKPLGVYNAELSNATVSPPIEVEAIIPDNQIDKTKTYFDLLLKPGEEENIRIKLSNITDREITVDVQNNDAVTNDNGLVDYSQKSKERDSTLTYPFSEISKAPEQVTIPKKSSVIIDVQIKMPPKEYKGIIAGGIYIFEKDTPKEQYTAATIGNKFVYSLGVQVRNEEDLKQVTPTLSLNEDKIISSRIEWINGLEINIQNTSAVFIRNLEIEAKVLDNSGHYLSHVSKKTELKMAPNSNFYFPLTWTEDEGPELDDGQYEVEVTAQFPASNRKWLWKVPISITKNQTGESDLEKEVAQVKHSSFTVCVSILCCGTLIIGVVFIWFRKRKI